MLAANSTELSGGSLARSRPLRVVIADDHPFYRDRLAIALRRSGLEVIGEVPDGLTAVDVAETASPDIILMDLRMPLPSGIAATRRLPEGAPPRRIVANSA